MRAGFKVTGVATSQRTDRLCRELGIPMRTLDELPILDVTVDGAEPVSAADRAAPPDGRLRRAGGEAARAELSDALQRQWASIEPFAPWENARSAAARAVSGVRDAVGAALDTQRAGARRGAARRTAAAALEVRACDNASLALIAPRTTPAMGSAGPAQPERPAPLALTPQHCNDGGDGGGGGVWPANASRSGFCSVTNDAVEGDCRRRGAGSWNTRAHRVRSLADCAARCLRCASCKYVSYSEVRAGGTGRGPVAGMTARFAPRR